MRRCRRRAVRRRSARRLHLRGVALLQELGLLAVLVLQRSLQLRIGVLLRHIGVVALLHLGERITLLLLPPLQLLLLPRLRLLLLARLLLRMHGARLRRCAAGFGAVAVGFAPAAAGAASGLGRSRACTITGPPARLAATTCDWKFPGFAVAAISGLP